jgi:hypothetical protein
LQIIFNPFEINACVKLLTPKFSRIMRLGPENTRKNPDFTPFWEGLDGNFAGKWT